MAKTETPAAAPASTEAQGAATATIEAHVPGSSPKSKESRGVAGDVITTWVPVDSTPAFNATLRGVAKFRKVKVADVLAGILTAAMTSDVVALLEADAAKAPEPKTRGAKELDLNALPTDPGEAAKVLEAAQSKAAKRLASATKAADAARTALANAKAKAAERGIVAAAPASDGLAA